MKRLAATLPLAGILLIAPYAAPQSRNIHEQVDPYTGLKILSLEVSTRICDGDPSPGSHDPEVHLLFAASENQNHTVSYSITPVLDQASYALSLRPGGTMDALIDRSAVTFTTPAGSTTTNPYAGDHSYLHETIPFTISQVELGRLSAAKSFQFRINGPRQEVQRCTDAKRLRNLGEFLGAAQTYGPSDLGADPLLKPIVEEVNPSNQLKKLTLNGVATQSCPGDPALGPQDADVRLVISANQRSDGGVWYFVATDLFHGATLGLRRGEKLETKMDGVPASFNTINGSALSSRPDAAGRPLKDETISFHVHQGDLIALSRASLLEFRLGGPNNAIHRCASADQFKHLGEFIGIAASYEPTHLVTASSSASH